MQKSNLIILLSKTLITYYSVHQQGFCTLVIDNSIYFLFSSWNFYALVFLFCSCSHTHVFFSRPACDYTTAEHYWSCYVDQPICGHFNHHSSVASGHHVHAPEGCPAESQDCPQVCNVPGKTQDKNVGTQTAASTHTALHTQMQFGISLDLVVVERDLTWRRNTQLSGRIHRTHWMRPNVSFMQLLVSWLLSERPFHKAFSPVILRFSFCSSSRWLLASVTDCHFNFSEFSLV